MIKKTENGLEFESELGKKELFLYALLGAGIIVFLSVLIIFVLKNRFLEILCCILAFMLIYLICGIEILYSQWTLILDEKGIRQRFLFKWQKERFIAWEDLKDVGFLTTSRYENYHYAIYFSCKAYTEKQKKYVRGDRYKFYRLNLKICCRLTREELENEILYSDGEELRIENFCRQYTDVEPYHSILEE